MTKTIARAPMRACTYLLRASETQGHVEYSVEGGDGTWISYPLNYYTSRRKDMAVFANIWKSAPAAARRRIVSEVSLVEMFEKS